MDPQGDGFCASGLVSVQKFATNQGLVLEWMARATALPSNYNYSWGAFSAGGNAVSNPTCLTDEVETAASIFAMAETADARGYSYQANLAGQYLDDMTAKDTNWHSFKIVLKENGLADFYRDGVLRYFTTQALDLAGSWPQLGVWLGGRSASGEVVFDDVTLRTPSAQEDCGSVYTLCGNGITETGEACDDGLENGQPGYCNSACNGTIPGGTCGNAVVEAGETCDTGGPKKTPSFVGGTAGAYYNSSDIQVVGNYAYVVETNESNAGRIAVYNISGSTPSLAGSVAITGASPGTIAIGGNRAFIGTSGGLIVFKISGQTAFTQIGSYASPSNVGGLFLAGSR